MSLNASYCSDLYFHAVPSHTEFGSATSLLWDNGASAIVVQAGG